MRRDETKATAAAFDKIYKLFAILLTRYAVEDKVEAVIGVGEKVDESGRERVLLEHVERVQNEERRDEKNKEKVGREENRRDLGLFRDRPGVVALLASCLF